MNSDLSRKTILLLGTGRSGTTWLAGVLASPFRYRLLFEPFQPHQVAGSESVADTYFRTDSVPTPVVSLVKRALNDEIDSDWIAQSSSRRLRMHRWRFWPRIRICKDVRTNLFLPNYRRLFTSQVSIVAMVRHPGAVVESFHRVKFPWASNVDRLLDQTELEEDFGTPVADLRRFEGSLAGRLAIRWVIENAYILRNLERLDVRLVVFERLLEEPVAELKKLIHDLEIEGSGDLESLVAKASYTTHPKSPLRKSQDPRWAWRERLSREDRSTLRDVLECAELDYEELTCLD